MSGWDEATGGFARAHSCACARYEGKRPTRQQIDRDGCPHDYVKGSTLCLYCNKAQVPQ